MKRFRLLLLFIPVVLQTVHAQTSQVDEQEALKRLGNKLDFGNRDKRSPDYSKSFDKQPLVFKNWHYGKVFFRDDTDMDSIRFNFDIDINAVVVQYNTDISAVSLKPDVVESFILHDQGNEREFIRKMKEDFKDIKYHMPFFEVLLGNDSPEELTILKQYKKEQVSADQQGSYKPVGFKAEADDVTYDFRVTYFIRSAEDNVYRKFGLSKKKVLGLFDKVKSKEVQSYVKSSKLKWNNESEMVEVIRRFFQ